MPSFTATVSRRSLTDRTVRNIRNLGKQGKLTQVQLAKRFRTSEASVSRILNGKQRASVI